MKLEDYIKSVEQLTKRGFYENEIKKIFNSIIKKMIEYQIYDTNQARGIFVDIARKDLGIDNMSLLREAINFWKKEYRYVGNGKFDSNLSFLNNVYDLTFKIYDEAVIQQEQMNEKYPSKNPELAAKRDNKDFKLNHLTFACDMANSGNNIEFEKELNELLLKIESVL